MWNDDGPCLLEASRSLEAWPARDRFLFVLSDGLPEGRRSGEAELHAAVARIRATTAQHLVGLGLGPGTSHVRTFYPNAIAEIEGRALPGLLGDLVEAALRAPETFAR